MNILHIIDSLVIGGAETLLVNTVNSLNEDDNIIVTLKSQNDFKGRLRCKKIDCIDFEKKVNFLSSVLQLRKIIKQNKIDIIHAHLFWSTLIARFACIGLNVKFVFSLHTVMSKDSFDNSKLMTLIENLTYSKNQIVIGVSETVLKDYDKIIGFKGESYVLYNFIDDKFFNEKNKIKAIEDNKVLKLIAVGNVKPVKNYDFLLDVFKELDNTKFSLDIFGEGDQKGSLELKVKEYNLNINFRGTVSNVSEILNNYDAYVMPSLFEGFGIAPLEAMAVGIPVILSDIDVFREIAVSETLFFNPNRIEELVTILNRVKIGEIDLYLNVDKAKRRAVEISKKANYLKKLKAIYLN